MARRLRDMWISARPRQWIKNVFVFLPLIFANLVFEGSAWLKAAVTFGVFCLASSGVYLWNDVIDRARDRLHPFKRHRPIASGKLPVAIAIAWATLCVTTAILLAFWVHVGFGTVIALYVGLNLLYTKWFRDMVIIDVFCIALFFVFRVVAGIFVLQVSFSYWMLILTALLALFLALNKRRYELVRLAKHAHAHRKVLLKYSPYYIDQMCAAIASAVMVSYILFTMDLRQVEKFGSYNLLFSVPCVFYGIFRYQYLVFKRGRGGDPAEIVLSDRAMLVNLLLWALLCGLAIYVRRPWTPLPLE